MVRSRFPACAGLLLAAGTLAGAIACSSGDDAPPVTTVPPRTATTAAQAGSTPGSTPDLVVGRGTGTATIEDLELPASQPCTPGEPAELVATYRSDAVQVTISVDNVAVEGRPPVSGSFTFAVPCDGRVHTVVLSAYDDRGESTVVSRAVLADDGRG